MFLAGVDAPASARTAQRPSPSGLVVAGRAAVKASLAALAGFVLCLGVALVVWAVTPSSGNTPVTLVRAGLAAFCGAAGMTMQIGVAHLTLAPLMLTAVIIALLIAVVGRGRPDEGELKDELTFVGAAAASFALTVTVVGTLGAGAAISASQWWRPGLLALVVIGIATTIRGAATREWLLDRLPAWVPASLRVGSAGLVALLAGGTVTLIVGLIRTFSDASTVQRLAAPGAAGGFGMFLLGLAYLPNAAVAATGYSTGVGFTVGSGTYTPFGSSPVELPAASLLTAVPDAHTVSRSALLVLLVPVVAGLVIGLGATRRLGVRADRLCAVGAASLFAAVAAVVVAELASGGVSGGEWSSSGPPPVLFGAAVAVVLGAVSATVVAVAPARARAVDRDQEDVIADDLVSDQDLDAESAQADFDSAEAGEDMVDVEMDEADEAVHDDPNDIRTPPATETATEAAATAPTARQRSGAAIPVPRDEDVIAGDSVDPDLALVTELRPRRRPGRAS